MSSDTSEADRSELDQEDSWGGFLAEARELCDTTREICSRLELDEVLHALVQRANRVLAGDVAYLAECDDRARLLRMRAFDNVRSDAFKKLTFPYRTGLGGEVAAERRAMAVSDYQGTLDDRVRHSTEVDEAVIAEGLRSGAAAPVEFEGRLLAVLFVAKRTQFGFSEHQLTLLSSLANTAAIAINNAQIHGQLLATIAMQERLMAVALADRGPTAVAQTLTELIHGPVLLLDWQGRSIANVAYRGIELKLPSVDQLHTFDGGSLPIYADTVHVIAIKLGCETEGYLVADLSNSEDGIGFAASQQSSTVFALELAKLRSAEQTELRLRGGLLDELLTRPQADPRELIRHAQRLGCELGARHAVAIIRFRQSAQLSDKPADQLIHRLVQTVSHAAWDKAGGTLVAERGNSVVVLVPASDLKTAQQTIERYIIRCRQAGLPEVVAGLGSITDSLDDYAEAHAEATHAVDVATRFEQAGPVVLFNQLYFHQVVLGARPSAAIMSMTRRFLAPLDEYDKRRRSDLIHTVAVFLESNGNAEAAARKLNVHPNTLRQRLDRISKQLGRDLNSATTRLDLALALEIRGLQPAPEWAQENGV